MKRRYWLGLGLVSLLAAGIGGVLVSDLDFNGHTDASYLHVNPAASGDSVNRTVAFSDLSRDLRRVFDRAVGDGDNSVRIPDGVDERVRIENRAVRYENRTYRVAVAVS